MAEADDIEPGSEDDPYKDHRDAAPWDNLITDARKYFQEWQDKCDSIDKLYADLKSLASDQGEREFQMFWANLEILKPSIYARPPVPVAVPRFKDFKELPRKASEILERTLVVTFEAEDIHATMIHNRDDLAICARGVTWVRHEPDEDGNRVCFDHIERQDFLHEPARKWEEVGWVAKRVWMSREAVKERFPKSDTSKMQFKSRKEMGQSDETSYQGEKKAEVWEIWHKTKNLVVWISPGMLDVLDIQPPFLNLDGFFPCPKPAFGTLQRGTLIPVPDFVYYRDQLEEINDLTSRIAALQQGLKLKGFYAAGGEDISAAIERAISNNSNNAVLVPVSNYAAMGGQALKDSIVWLPVKDVAEVINQCVLLRRQLIDDVYQITGLSDIMRGATDPNETLGAQELKSQYGSIRIRDRQAELVRLARDLTRIAAEIIAENYTPEELTAMSQVELPTQQQIAQQQQQIVAQAAQMAQSPEAQQAMQQNPQAVQQAQQQVQQQIAKLDQTVTIDKVVALLREQKVRPFVLEIETDSTIQPDEDMEKQRRTEYVTAVGGLLQQMAPIAQSMPAAVPFAGELLKFASAPFRAGRSMEGAIDQFVESMKQTAQQQMQNPKPSPEEMKAQAEQQKIQMEAQAKQQQMAADAQSKQQDALLKKQLGEMELFAKREELRMQREEMLLKLEYEREKLGIQRQKTAMDMQASAQKHELDMEARRESSAQDLEHKAAIAKQALENKPKKEAA